VQMNRRTPSVGHNDPWSCATCSIKGCEDCVYNKSGEARCAKCFDGFTGKGGEPGRWEQCQLWNSGFVLSAVKVLISIVALVFLLAMVMTCIGAFHRDLLKWLHFDVPRRAGGLESPLVDSLNQNKASIRQGLRLSLMSSIKSSSMRIHRSEDERASTPTWKHINIHKLDQELVDIGLGLQLFYNTQRFFICMALVTWLFAVAVGFAGPEDPKDYDVSTSCSHPLDLSLQLGKMQIIRAHVQGSGCLLLWAVLLVMSWGFHCYQLRFVESYDKRTHTAEDYTIKLEGLPPSLTSERELKRMLEEELRMRGEVHGVCICYNVLELPNPERIDEMIDHLVEKDDLDLGIYDEEVYRPKAELEAELEKDAEELKGWLREGKLQSSGTAYVVFRKQRDVAQLMMLRRGIARKVFEGRKLCESTGEDSDEDDKSEIKTVKISKDNCEPSGVRFEAFQQPPRKHQRNENVWMPLRMVIYISIYAVAAHLFFVYMIKPWEDNFIEGGETSLGVKVGSKVVLVLNFGIQTLVMVDVERGGFLRTAEVDKITFIWNTVLLLVTNSYVIVQEVYRDGYRWVLVPPQGCQEVARPPDHCWAWLRLLFQSVATERQVGQNLVSVLTDQIMMLYVLGEAANVLMPVIFYYVALRLIFVMHVGGSTNSCFQRMLRAMLPSSSSATTISVREAEKAQILMPLLLWMEYTYIVIFPAMTLVTFYLLTDDTSMVCLWLLIFSLLHFFWQRGVMLWLYGKATYDSTESYEAFILMWGLVLSMLPPAAIWWAFRRGEIQEPAFAFLSMALVFLLVLLVWRYGLFLICWCIGARDDGIDELVGGDPGYADIIDKYQISWWNRNPVYVLKHRHCRDLEGHEVHGSDVQCWPKGASCDCFFELGKEFRMTRRKVDPLEERSTLFADVSPAQSTANGHGASGAPEASPREAVSLSTPVSPGTVTRPVAAAAAGVATSPRAAGIAGGPAAAGASPLVKPAAGQATPDVGIHRPVSSASSLSGSVRSQRPSLVPSASTVSVHTASQGSLTVATGAHHVRAQAAAPLGSSLRVPAGSLVRVPDGRLPHAPAAQPHQQHGVVHGPQFSRSPGQPVSAVPAHQGSVRTVSSVQIPAAVRQPLPSPASLGRASGPHKAV